MKNLFLQNINRDLMRASYKWYCLFIEIVATLHVVVRGHTGN